MLQQGRSITKERQTVSLPNLLTEPLVILFFVGMLLETAVAASQADHALWTGGIVSIVATMYMVWFWFSVTCSAGLLVALYRYFNQSKIVGLAILGVAVAATFAYLVSWGIYLQTGRFANYETVRFMLFNWSMLEDYMMAADRTQVFWGAVFCLATIVAVPLIGIWIYRCHKLTQVGSKARIGWAFLTIAMVMPLNHLLHDMSWQRLFGNLDRLTGCLNPGASLFASAWEIWYTEPIEDCLDESKLTPISMASVAHPQRKKNIIIVAVESLRPDMIGFEHQGKQVLPNINQLAQTSLTWSKAYAQSTHSDYADVCIVSSLYPLRSRRHHFYHHDDPWPKTTLYDVLRPHGYSTAIISSQNEAWGCMDEFLQTDGLDFFYHPQNSDAPSIVSERDPGFYMENLSGALVAGKFADGHTADIAIDWITTQTRAQNPFYLSMNLQSSHFPYLIPDDVPTPFQPCELPVSVKFSSYEPSLVPVVRNAYYNGIHECDRQIGRLIEHLKSLGVWENTILVVTGENGEAFHENGCVGHACNPNEPVIHIANLISAPGLLDGGETDYPMEHVDLCPTLLGLLGSSNHGNFQGIDVLSPNRPEVTERLLFSHVLSPIAVGDSVQFAGRWKFMTTHEYPGGLLFDLENDPGESNDLSSSLPNLRNFLFEALETWRGRQLAYYYLPKYYTNYFPPKPPTVSEIESISGIRIDEVLNGHVSTNPITE